MEQNKKFTVKKTTWIKAAAVSVSALPPIVVLCLNYPIFIQDTGKSISAAALLVAIICACIFKDTTKKIFSTPSAFKICVCVFLFSLIAVSLGQQLLEISATALVSGACGVPLNMWYNYETKPITTNDMLEALKDLLKGGGVNEEEQPHENP